MEKVKVKWGKKKADMTPEEQEVFNAYKRDIGRKYYKTMKPRWKSWEVQGIKVPLNSEDFKKQVWEEYQKQEICLCCCKYFTEKKGKLSKCLDHHHATGYPRMVCCMSCNIKIGKVEDKKMRLLLEIERYGRRNFDF